MNFAIKEADILMRNTEENLSRMHARAAELRRKSNRTRTGIAGAVSGALAICLVFVMHQIQSVGHGIIGGQTTGSSLLSDSAGGYVLVAVVAFAAGVAITALIYKYRNWDPDKDEPGKTRKSSTNKK